MINIRLVKKEDLKELAKIYKDLFGKSILNEDWSIEKSLSLLDFFYKLQEELFVVAEVDKKVVGAVMLLVKPWHDGNRLIETEIFVANDYQRQGIASRLFHKHFELAIEKYDTKIMEAHTYEEENGYPLNWYKKQGYKVINEFDWAEEAGYTLENSDFKVLYMKNVDATIYDVEGNELGNYKF